MQNKCKVFQRRRRVRCFGARGGELLTDISCGAISCAALEDDSDSELDLAGSTGGVGAGTGQHAILTRCAEGS